jgi:hypothetical protein
MKYIFLVKTAVFGVEAASLEIYRNRRQKCLLRLAEASGATLVTTNLNISVVWCGFLFNP